MNLGRFKIAHKILAVIVLLCLVAGGIAAGGVLSLRTLRDAAEEMDQEGNDEVLAALIDQDAVDLSRAEFRIAANPTGDNLRRAKQEIAEQRRELEDHVAKAKATADEEQAKLLAAVERDYKAYLVDLEATLAKADSASTQVALSDVQKSVVDSAMTSGAAVKELEDASQSYIDYTKKISDHLSAEAVTTYEDASVVMVVSALMGIVLGLIAGWLVSQKGIVNPIRRIVECLRALTEGKLDTVVFGRERSDEVGEIAQATQVFKEQAIELGRVQAAAKDAEKRAEEEKRRSMHALADGFQASVGEIVKSVAVASTQLQSTAQTMTATAEETGRQSTAVAAASEEATTNVQTIASATEELSSSIAEISRQVNDAAQIALRAFEDTRRTDGTVQGLSDGAQKIGDVVKLISDIASQTNLLALNATIEAARAGEAGKGFAVVASEVKNLATQTARATEDIAAQINAMQSATTAAVAAIRAIGATVEQISGISTAIASAVEQQGAATKEIARNVEQAAIGTKEVTRNVDGVSQAATQTGQSANEVLEATRTLAQSAGAMRTQIEEFLLKVKAA